MLRAILSETFGCTGTWLRKSHRTVLILLLLASLSYFLLTPFTPSLFIEVAHILACVCGGEAGVCVLDLLSPRLTAGRRKHIFWLLLLTCGIFYATSTNTGTGNVEQPRSNQSILCVGITPMVPVWMGLYAKALFDEQFLSVYDRCDDNLSAISAFNLYNTMGNPPSTTASAGQPSKQRASALLALTFVIRFVLKMLNSIGLAIEDLVYLNKTHAGFVSAITAAQDREALRRHLRLSATLSSLDVIGKDEARPSPSPPPTGATATTLALTASPSSLSPMAQEEDLRVVAAHDHAFDKDEQVVEMTEACVAFLIQTMSIFVTKLRSHVEVGALEAASNDFQNQPKSPLKGWRNFGRSGGGGGGGGGPGGGPGLVQSGNDTGSRSSSTNGNSNSSNKDNQNQHRGTKVTNRGSSERMFALVDLITQMLGPLPYPLEPEGGVLHFCLSSVLVMVGSKYFIKPFSISLIGKRGTAMSKIARSGLLMYMVGRLIINYKSAAVLYLEQEKLKQKGRF